MNENRMKEILVEELDKFDKRLYKGIENYFNKRIDYVIKSLGNNYHIVKENNLLLKDCADEEVISRLKKEEARKQIEIEIEKHLQELKRLGYNVKK